MALRRSQRFPDDVCIVGGAGHVGLPLGLAFAQKGQRVTLYDLNPVAVETIGRGELPFAEQGAEPILREFVNRKLFATTDAISVSRAKFVVVTVGTPVDEHLNPDLRAVPRVMTALRPHLSTDQTIIIRSTVFPGTCRQVSRVLGPAWHVAYCPERIAQGHAIRELSDLPQIVSGTTAEASREAAQLFGLIAPQIITVSVEEAELVKLFSNAWRYIKFAAANQFYIVAKDLGVDYNSVWRAMTTGYARNAGLPTPGLAAGPCLMKDTMQVLAASNGRFTLGQASATINEGMPVYMVDDLRKRYDLRQARVGILGMTFKGDIDDIRDSLAYKLRKLLEFYGADVVCSDEYFSDSAFVSKEELVASCEIVIVGAPHAGYRTLSIPPAVEVVDLWGVCPAAIPAAV